MEIVTGLFVVGLYHAIEKIWDKGFDAAWEPVDERLKERFKRLAGRDKASQREAAFLKAADVARGLTLRQAANPQQAERILDTLDREQNRRESEALAEEAAKLMLFSATPDVPRLTGLVQERLKWQRLWGEDEPPDVKIVATVLSGYLSNLREALLDQEPYHDLIQREMLRELRKLAGREMPYDDEATYRYQVAEMNRRLEFVGIPELKDRRPITIEDIFIHLRAEREAESRQIPNSVLAQLTEEERESLLSEDLTREQLVGLSQDFGVIMQVPSDYLLKAVGQRLEIDEVLRNTSRIVLLGDPGSGKSTLLKYLVVICAEGQARDELGLDADRGGSLLPVFVPLREFARECLQRDDDYSLMDYFYTCARERLLLRLPPGFFEEALDAGRCLVCLDGLDEVWAVGQRKVISDAVKALAARYSHSRYVVTSRRVGYEETPLDRSQFAHHTILPLDDEDVLEFVRKWYALREQDPVQRKNQTDSLISTIERQPRIRTLARNPLLLTIIALVHRIEAELPHERVKLYDKCVTALVDTWEEVKGLTLEEKHRPFFRYRHRLLERLAFELHSRAEGAAGDGAEAQMQTVRAGDLELLLTRFLMENRRLGFADDADGARDEACAFIRLARGRTGLLVERGEGLFAFPHLTFQEYLAACDIERRCIHHGVNALWAEIAPHLHDPHWREVILLLLGSLNKYDAPPTLLVEKILEVGIVDEFETVLHRSLFLAAHALADRVDVATDLRRQIVDDLLILTRDAPSWVRDDALDALSRLECDGYTSNRLLALAWDQSMDTEARYTATQVLGQLDRTDDIVAETVSEALRKLACDEDVDAKVRCGSAQALGQMGHERAASDILIALARDQRLDYKDLEAIAGALLRLRRSEEAVALLVCLARDPQVKRIPRRHAIHTLVEVESIEIASDSLLKLANDTEIELSMRCTAVEALGKLGYADKAEDILLTWLSDSQDYSEHRTIVWALDRLGHAKKPLLDSLQRLALDAQPVDTDLGRIAATALGKLGRPEIAARILSVIARNVQVDVDTRMVAAWDMGHFGLGQEAAEILLSFVKDPEIGPADHCDAVYGLRSLTECEGVADTLLSLLGDPQEDNEVRSEVASTLKNLSDVEEGTLHRLQELILDPHLSDKLRHAIALTLSDLSRAGQAVEILLALACDQEMDADVRVDAAQALGGLDHAKEAVENLLIVACNKEVDAKVRCDAAQALAGLGCAESAAGVLLTLTRDDALDAQVRGDAYCNLKRLLGAQSNF